MGTFYFKPEYAIRWQKEIKDDLPSLTGLEVTITDTSSGTLCVALKTGEDGLVANFQLAPFPRSTAIIISLEMFVAPKFRRRGIATVLLKHKRRIAADLGASTLMATVNVHNAAEQGCLKKDGWAMLTLPGIETSRMWVTNTKGRFYF